MRRAGAVLCAVLVLGGVGACGGQGEERASDTVETGGDGSTGDETDGDETNGNETNGNETNGNGSGEALPDQQSGVLIGAVFADAPAHDFETVPVGGSRTLFVTVRSTRVPFETTEVSVTGTGFSLVDASSCQGVALAELGATCEVQVAFSPVSVGLHEGQLTVRGLVGPPPAEGTTTETSAPPVSESPSVLTGSGLALEGTGG